LRSFIVVFLVACGTGDTTIDITHDPCAGVALDGGTTTAQRAGLDGALRLWRDLGVAVAGSEPSTIEVVFEPASAAFRGVYDDERSVIHINDGIEEPGPLEIVIAHELGHAFGLPHVTDRPSLMNPANLTQPPTDLDREAVEALWGRCDPISAGNR
jgi:hypothetical protein